MEKRFQYYSKNGIQWTNWFTVKNSEQKEKWQLKNKLLNEYRNVQ